MEVYYSRDRKNTCANSCVNSIVEIIESIAKSQRNVCSTCAECVSCDACFNALYNTIPIRLATCCDGTAINGLIGAGGASTSYFRVECITDKRYVKLRLLSVTADGDAIVIAGTNYTMVVDLECVGSIQCFEPVNILPCTAPTA